MEGGLGFRNLEVFNSAMLAKQFWRLHLYPISLLAYTLKARYYPKYDVWKANVGHYPSYGWRNIWGSRKLLLDGACWKIGRGDQVRVWGDAWLPGPGSRRVISPCPEADRSRTVDSFFDPTNREWKSRDLESVFLPFEVTKILSIPLKPENSEDELCWAYSKDDILRVKDVYRLALGGNSGASCSFGSNSIWKKLWQLRVPPKVRDFAWRICWNIIPHGINLAHKGVSDFIRCATSLYSMC